MKHVLTTPNMDRFAPLVASLFRGMGCEFVVPPRLTTHTRELGRQLGREGFCQPLNNNIADLFLALEAGATSVVATQGVDACRYGWYWVNEKVVLEDRLGREIPFFVISHVEPRASVERILDAVGCRWDAKRLDYEWLAIQERIRSLVELNRLANQVRAVETSPGATARVYDSAVDAILAAEKLTDIRTARREGQRQITGVRQDRARDVVRVLLVGAIYEVLEPESNYVLEEYLGQHGIAVERSLGYNDLVPFVESSGQAAYDRREAMMEHFAGRFLHPRLAEEGFGGYGMHTIAHAARARHHGFHGILHVHSFSCMPEIVAKAFIREIGRRDEIPTISIVVEEVHSRDLFYNRLEAFVDLTREKRRRRES